MLNIIYHFNVSFLSDIMHAQTPQDAVAMAKTDFHKHALNKLLRLLLLRMKVACHQQFKIRFSFLRRYRILIILSPL